MPAFTIYANGVDMGRFDEPSEPRAIHAYASSLGYASILDAAETLEKSVEEFLAEITVVEVSDDA